MLPRNTKHTSRLEVHVKVLFTCLLGPLSFLCLSIQLSKNLLIHQVHIILGTFPSNERKATFKVPEKTKSLNDAYSCVYINLWLI